MPRRATTSRRPSLRSTATASSLGYACTPSPASAPICKPACPPSPAHARPPPASYRPPPPHPASPAVFTHPNPVRPYRGTGRPEAAYVIERLVDFAADELGIDPAELRRKNYIPPEAMPFKTGLT